MYQNLRPEVAPQVGLEPTTTRLTAECSAIELLRIIRRWRSFPHLQHLSLDPGDVLLSRAVASQVPSALRGLTSVFGMGTGGSLSLLSPEIFSCFPPLASCAPLFPSPRALRSLRAAPSQLHSFELPYTSFFSSLPLSLALPQIKPSTY